MNDGYRHSLCRECWNKKRRGLRSSGHETPVNRRVSENCCFCLNKHKSGIQVAKNPQSRELRCGALHAPKLKTMTRAEK